MREFAGDAFQGGELGADGGEFGLQFGRGRGVGFVLIAQPFPQFLRRLQAQLLR